MTVKTEVSRFHIHDELTAPDKSVPILKTVISRGAGVSKMLGVLAGNPAVLRAYMRMWAELRSGVLARETQLRIALAVAQHRGDEYSVAQHARTAKAAGLSLDEIAKARSFTSADPRQAGLLLYLKGVLESEGSPPAHLHESARELDWTDEEILEAVAHLALAEFQSLVANASELPSDQPHGTVLPSAA